MERQRRRQRSSHEAVTSRHHSCKFLRSVPEDICLVTKGYQIVDEVHPFLEAQRGRAHDDQIDVAALARLARRDRADEEHRIRAHELDDSI